MQNLNEEIQVDPKTIAMVLKDLKTYHNRLTKLILPIIGVLPKNRYPFTSEAKRFLKNYKSLLSVYTSQLFFFVSMHLENGLVKSHPVLLKLIDTKEKIQKSEAFYKAFKGTLISITKELNQMSKVKKASSKLALKKKIDSGLERRLKAAQEKIEEDKEEENKIKKQKKSKKKRKTKKLKDQIFSLGLTPKSSTGNIGKREAPEEDSSSEEDVLNLT